MEKTSAWFRETKLGKDCNLETHCALCPPSGDCDSCGTFQGRWISAVSDYASTCDGCGELTHHDLMEMDPLTQLGYCRECIPGLPKEIRERLKD